MPNRFVSAIVKHPVFSLEQPLIVPMSMCWKWRPTRNRCVTYWKNMTLLPLLATRLALKELDDLHIIQEMTRNSPNVFVNNPPTGKAHSMANL